MRSALLTVNAIVLLAVLLGGREEIREYLYESDDGWAAETRFIAHALGGVDTVTYTNSYEAFRENYERGLRVFEVDLELTSDSALVAVHNWLDSGAFGANGPISLEDFRTSRIYGSYTPLTAADLLRILRDHPDIRLVLDTKSDPYHILDRFVTLARRDDPALLDRVIPQLYEEDLSRLLRVHRFRSVLYTAYRSSATDQDIASFIRRSGVGVVTIPAARATPNFVRKLRGSGAMVFVHTVNRPDEFEAHRAAGVHGVYTDFLSPAGGPVGVAQSP